MTTGAIHPNTTNYITLPSQILARYVELTIPNGITGVRVGRAFPTVTEQRPFANPWDGINLPATVTTDFSLPQVANNGQPITWVSANTTNIRIDENIMARVTRPSGQNVPVILTASIPVGEPSTRQFTVTVLQQAVVNPPGGGGGGGGGGGITNNVVVEPVPPTLPDYGTGANYVPPAPPEYFNDLNEASWARDYIMSLYQRGIVNGRGNGQFAPNGTLLREEMARLVIVAFEIETNGGEVTFSDVSPSAWHYNYVRAMYTNGITLGMGDGLYGVGLNISRQDAALLLMRVLENIGVELAAPSEHLFADDASIAPWARDGVYVMRALGIIGGDENGYFNPTDNVSRAQISRMIYAALELR